MAGIQNNIIFSQGEKLQQSSSRDINEMQNASTDVSRINHTGDPEGVVSANPSSLCHDPVSGDVYVKQSGTGNTGWSLIATTSTDLHTALYIVGKTLDHGANYTVISDAVADAVAAGVNATIFIQPGTYLESFQMFPGISLTAYPCDSLTPNVIIDGFLTIVLAGDYSISNICFSTTAIYPTSALIIEAIDGSTVTNTNIFNCSFNTTAAGTKAIDEGSLNANSKTNFLNCNFDVTQNNSWHFSKIGEGSLFFFNCNFLNTGGSDVANTCSSGGLNITNSTLHNQLELSGDSLGTFTNLSLDSSAQNEIAVTTSDTANFGLHFCRFVSGTASAISIGDGSTISAFNTELYSSNTNVITGSGTLNYSLITFSGSSSGHNVTTENPFPFIPSSSSALFIANLTANAANVTGDGTQYTVIFDDAIKNQGGVYNTSTGEFTAPVTGTYLFNFCVNYSGLMAQTVVFQDIVATSRTIRGNILNPINSLVGGAIQQTMTCVIDMTASDTVVFKAAASGSTKTVTVSGNASSLCITYASGYLIV